MTRSEVINLRAQLSVALDNLKIKGFKFELLDCTFGATAVFKLDCRPITKSGEVVNPEAELFKTYAALFGLKPENLGENFISQGSVFYIKGINPRRRKYPIIAERASDGRRFKFSSQTVKMCLERGE